VTDGCSRLPRRPTLAARKLPLNCGSCRGAAFGSNWTKKRTQSLSDIQLSGSSAILALDVRSSGPQLIPMKACRCTKMTEASKL
jgi:hypothetical protein